MSTKKLRQPTEAEVKVYNKSAREHFEALLELDIKTQWGEWCTRSKKFEEWLKENGFKITRTGLMVTLSY